MSVAGFQPKEKKRLAPLAIVVLVSIVVPMQLHVGALLLTPSRIVFLCIVPVLLIKLIMGAYGAILLTDIFIFLYVLWLSLSIFINNFDVAVTFIGMQTISILGGYLAARATIRSLADFQAFARFYAFLVIFLLPFALYEAVTSQFIIPKILSAIPGVTSVADVNYDRRMGLDRAQVVFSHPIHFGLYCSMALALYFVTFENCIGLMRRAAIASTVMVTCFLSVSSGPFLAAIFQILLIGYWIVTRSNEKQWKILLLLLFAGYLVLEVMSDRPAIYALASRLAFNPMTAQVRMTLFNYGMEQIAMTPIFGVGYNPWALPSWMTGSVDNFWLMLAVVSGVPCFMFFAGAFFNTLIRAGGKRLRRGSDLYNARVGWSIVMVSVGITLGTVAIWGELLSMVLFVIGSGCFLFYAHEDEAGSVSKAPEKPRRRAIFGDIAARSYENSRVESEPPVRPSGAESQSASKRTVL